MTDTDPYEGLNYSQLLHAMQTGVAHIIESGTSTETEPKHLRVGVNSAMVEAAALVHLLVDKGLITLEEWEVALTAMMKREVETYSARVNQAYGGGANIVLR